MNTNLEGKIVLITGGAAGIGRATTLKFSEEGAIPVFVDKDKEKGNELSKYFSSLKRPYTFLFGDLTDEGNCKKFVEEVINDYDRLDVLINNAGKNDRCDIEVASPQEFRKSLEGNLIHYYSMTHYAWPHLKSSKGNIVFTGSRVALTGDGDTTAYAAAKGAIVGLTRELAAKSARQNLGIRVNCVLPGDVATQLYYDHMHINERYSTYKEGLKDIGKRIPFEKRATTPEEIANTIVFLASDLSSHTTGQLIFPDGGFVHLDRTI